ncbi:Txe/YoeB family addiction module toxin [Allofrancisella frigidaquae]|uniref:Toxin YoeB n=1 Tax=Allofrancisella frigidaquae TaxID=1085644 RepID=A0A6M3HUP8_9GAMM|nr:Txe/YoeB family addiction module toxin [Allofrancisella frigidaquae]QIV94837.1 Txe/YoeB family addiction module toxin [Allofrancisella frigidaquae]
MKLLFTDEAWEEYLYWQSYDKKIIKKINSLIKEVKKSPFEGTGNPEPLKYDLSGFWSRRIDREHRLVYKIDNDTLFIVQCRYHY